MSVFSCWNIGTSKLNVVKRNMPCLQKKNIKFKIIQWNFGNFGKNVENILLVNTQKTNN